MARWGMLADIHGNRPALDRALAALRDRGAEHVAVLGDNLGRGDADACVSLVRAVADVSVLGNRDLDWHQRVGAEAADYVRGLPARAVRDGIAFSHGDRRLTPELATSGLATGFRRARRWLAEAGCGLWFFGHSHRARLWIVAGAEAEPAISFDAAGQALPARYTLPDDLGVGGACALINVGSVGLPFPGKGPASAVLYDSASRTVEFFAV